jgi:hypothetical protein
MQNEPNLPPAAPGPAGPIARNKANCPPGTCRARACPELAEGTPNPRRAQGLSCETNPISAVAAVESLHYSSIPPFQRSSPRGVGRGGNRAKRTQFPAGPDGTGLGAGPWVSYKQSQFRGSCQGGGVPNLPTRASHTCIRGQTKIPLPPTVQAVSFVIAGSDGPMPRGSWTNSVQWGYSWFQDGYQRIRD